MTSEGQNAIRSFVERIEAFLLTHDDDHPMAVGCWKWGKDVGCPVRQVVGVCGIIQAVDILLPGKEHFKEPWASLHVAIGRFIRIYDEETGGDDAHRMDTLKNVRGAIEAGILDIRKMFGIERESIESATRIPVHAG